MSLIKSIVRKQVSTERLYNLAVEDDESYIANGIVVHNCKSRLVPNEKGDKNNPEIARKGTPLTQKQLDTITLCEHDYHITHDMLSQKIL